VYCQIADFGHGFTRRAEFGVRPGGLSDNGRGLWLVETLADRVIVANGHDASDTGAAVTVVIRRH
jgi:anti-sigma regulatory factor (Ser/Thr protein kinase)